MSDVNTLREALRGSRARLFAPIQRMTEEQFRYAADDAGWNIATHLAHVLRCERMLVERSSLALREHEPTVRSTGTTNDDDPALAQRLAVPQIIHGMQASRRDVESLLERAGDHGFGRAIIHERSGRVTVGEMTDKIVAHEQEHAEAVEQLARQARSAQRVTIPLSPRS